MKNLALKEKRNQRLLEKENFNKIHNLKVANNATFCYYKFVKIGYNINNYNSKGWLDENYRNKTRNKTTYSRNK